jgi:hypothetical protein
LTASAKRCTGYRRAFHPSAYSLCTGSLRCLVHLSTATTNYRMWGAAFSWLLQATMARLRPSESELCSRSEDAANSSARKLIFEFPIDQGAGTATPDALVRDAIVLSTSVSLNRHIRLPLSKHIGWPGSRFLRVIARTCRRVTFKCCATSSAVTNGSGVICTLL